MLLKKLTISTLLVIFLICTSIVPAFAADNDATEYGTPIGYIWDQSTGEVITYDPSTFPTEVEIPIKPDKLKDKDKENKNGTVTPMLLYMYTFDHYAENSQYLSWKAHYVGVTRVDNSANYYTSASLIFTASVSDSWSVSGTTGAETSIELDAIYAKVKGTSSIGASWSRAWTGGMTYGTESSVPPRQIGTVTAYIPGTSSNGYAVYKVTNTSNDDWWYQDRARGAMVPALTHGIL